MTPTIILLSKGEKKVNKKTRGLHGTEVRLMTHQRFVKTTPKPRATKNKRGELLELLLSERLSFETAGEVAAAAAAATAVVVIVDIEG